MHKLWKILFLIVVTAGTTPAAMAQNGHGTEITTLHRYNHLGPHRYSSRRKKINRRRTSQTYRYGRHFVRHNTGSSTNRRWRGQYVSRRYTQYKRTNGNRRTYHNKRGRERHNSYISWNHRQPITYRNNGHLVYHPIRNLRKRRTAHY